MNKTAIGTCSLCGGAVTMPTIWMAVIPPPITCEQCGAQKAAHGPVIDMTQPAKRVRNTGTGGVVVDDGNQVFYGSTSNGLKFEVNS